MEIWGHSFSPVVGVSGDVSNVFRVPLTLWKVSGDSGMLIILVAEDEWNDPVTKPK